MKKKVEDIDDSEPIQKFNISGLNSINSAIRNSATSQLGGHNT